ncbi:unnamed protein product [Cylindrotheca closterium]|uniref:Uncharacterized protein n=1 Tax=Cylindrotheca closterium TaxID=2856 RepID=A0AAD2G658_9STRA|nr:unnamed protein product [Cylindrotheca closterium]
MTSDKKRRSLFLLLSQLVLVSSFGPSVPPQYSQVLKEDTLELNNPIDENRANLLKEDARTAVFAASIGMNDTMILEKYRTWYKKPLAADGTTDLSDYTTFRRSFLRNLERTLSPENTDVDETASAKSTAKTTEEAATVVDELMVRSEYEKWLVKNEKEADESRYPQFRKNYIQQFERDLKEGQFFSLNEFGDCTEAEANAIRAERAVEEAKIVAAQKKAEAIAIMAAKAVAEAEKIKAEKALADAQAKAAEKEAEAKAKVEKEAAEARAKARVKATKEKSAFKARAIEAAAKAAAAKAAKAAKARAVEGVAKDEFSMAEIKFADVPENIPESVMAQRYWESNMYTPSVRRDIYRVLRNSADLTAGLSPQEATMHKSIFSVALLTRKDSFGNVNGYAFVNRRALDGSIHNNKYTPCDDYEVLEAIKSVGYPTEHGIALTVAFENYLSGVAGKWGDSDAATLSVEFLVAFTNEMTKRLDVNHRIRSSKLSESDVAILKTEPFSACVDIKALQSYGTYTNEEPVCGPSLDRVLRRKRPKTQKKIVEALVRTQFDADAIEAREQDSAMFSASLRRDIYKVLRNPNNILFGASIPINEKTDVLGAVLLARKGVDGSYDTFAFADRQDYEAMPAYEKENFFKLDDRETVEAISHIGSVNPVSIAVTEAFEAYLSQLVVEWGDRDVAHFSVEFLVAFGQELSKRLDINNRLRSTKVSREEMLLLATHPFAGCVDPAVMQYYQEENRV